MGIEYNHVVIIEINHCQHMISDLLTFPPRPTIMAYFLTKESKCDLSQLVRMSANEPILGEGSQIEGFRNAYFRSRVQSSRKLWPKPNSVNSVPCILPCKLGGFWNLI